MAMKPLFLRLSLAPLVVLTVLLIPANGEDPGDSPKRIAAALEPFVKERTLAGAVTLVADKEKVLSLEAVGFADIGANTMMAVNALFWIASQSKPITAAALMMLVDEGKIGLDDPVEKYLPEFAGHWLVLFKGNDPVLLVKPDQNMTVYTNPSHTHT